MKKIIYVQNGVVAGLITVILLITGFYELSGLKLVIVAVMGFFVIDYLILQVERMWLRWRNESKGKAKGDRGAVPGIPWYEHKMRHPGTVETDGNTRGITAAVQKGTRHDPIRTGSRYSR